MKSTKHITTFIIILILSITVSCSKDQENCNENLGVDGPASVIEGESLTLEPFGYSTYQAINTDYYWEYPNMEGYNNTVSGMILANGTNPITIENVDVRDNGEYFFRIMSGDDDCPQGEGKHTLTVIPKTSPCFNDLSTQYLIIDESFSSDINYQSYTPVLTEHWSGDEFEVRFSMPMFSYYLNIEFDIPIPDYSSTYKLRNSLDLTSDDDPIINAHIEFSPDNEPADTYRTDDLQNDLYLKREGDMMYLSFCNVVFTHQSIASKTITISGKAQVQL